MESQHPMWLQLLSQDRVLWNFTLQFLPIRHIPIGMTLRFHLRSFKPRNLLSPIPREPFSCLIFPHTNYPLFNRLYLCKTINKSVKMQRGKQFNVLPARASTEIDWKGQKEVTVSPKHGTCSMEKRSTCSEGKKKYDFQVYKANNLVSTNRLRKGG